MLVYDKIKCPGKLMCFGRAAVSFTMIIYDIIYNM